MSKIERLNNLAQALSKPGNNKPPCSDIWWALDELRASWVVRKGNDLVLLTSRTHKELHRISLDEVKRRFIKDPVDTHYYEAILEAIKARLKREWTHKGGKDE